MENFFRLLGIWAACLVPLHMLPEIWGTWRTGSSRQRSLFWTLFRFLGFLALAPTAAFHGDNPAFTWLVLVSLAFSAVAFFQVIYYRRGAA